jgi:hypothetical protein
MKEALNHVQQLQSRFLSWLQSRLPRKGRPRRVLTIQLELPLGRDR